MTSPVVVLLLLFTLTLVHCDYPIGSFQIDQYDPHQFNHRVHANVYYPKTNNSCPGFIGSASFYSYLWEFFVPQGYIMALESSYDFDPISTPLWKARDLAFILDYLRNESESNPNSPIYGLAGKTAISSGHSEGGVASIIATDANALNHDYTCDFDATLVLSGCFGGVDPDESEIEDSLKHNKHPIMWITGTEDCVCTPKLQTYYYDMSVSECKYFANVVNGSHCYFGTGNEVVHVLCEALEIMEGCGLDYYMPREELQKLVKLYAHPWIQFTIGGDPAAKASLDSVLKHTESQGLVHYQSACHSSLN